MNKREVNLLLRQSFYYLSDIAFAVDKKLKVVLLNKKAKDFFDLKDIDSVLDKDVSYLIKDKNIENLIVRFIKDKDRDFKEDIIHIDESKIFLLSMILVKNSQSNVVGALVYLKNLTQAKKIQESTVNLFTKLVNEVSQPITAVKGYIETLLDGLYKDKDLTLHFLSIINNELNRLIQLIINLRSFSKKDSSNIQFKKCNLFDLISDSISIVKKFAETKKVDIKNEIEKGDFVILCDMEKLKQVFINVLDNAIKYNNSENPFVIVRLDSQQDYWIIDFIDNSILIEDEEKDLIFDRFYRGKAASKLKIGGSGLGLWVAKEIMKLHKGRIQYLRKDNRNIFRIYLRREN